MINSGWKVAHAVIFFVDQLPLHNFLFQFSVSVRLEGDERVALS